MGKDFDALVGFIVLVLGATVVLKILANATKQTKYLCPRCRAELRYGTTSCPTCGMPLHWS